MNYTYSVKPSIEPFGGTLIESVLADAYSDIIYDGWSISKMGAAEDFGGGVIGVSCEQLYNLCEGSHYKLANLFPGLTRSDAKEIIAVIANYREE